VHEVSKSADGEIMKKTKVYVLELWGNPVYSGVSVIFDVAGVSLDRSVLEKLKAKKDKELEEEFPTEEGDEGEDDEDGDFGDEEYCLHNTDLSDRPYWSISTYDLK